MKADTFSLLLQSAAEMRAARRTRRVLAIVSSVRASQMDIAGDAGALSAEVSRRARRVCL